MCLALQQLAQLHNQRRNGKGSATSDLLQTTEVHAACTPGIQRSGLLQLI